MLIALALAVSGIFFSWLSQFTQSHREEFQKCAGAHIAIKAYYSPDTGSIGLAVYNAGDIPLTGFSVIVSYPGTVEAIKDFVTREIMKEDTEILQVKYNGSIKTITVQSVECRNAQDMVDIHDVSGL